MNKAIITALIGGLLLTGCVSADGPLPAAELQAALTNKTWKWQAEGTGAGLYFGPGGTGVMKANGRTRNIKWYTANGRFCAAGSCWLVYRSGGKTFSRSTRGGSPYPWSPYGNLSRGNKVF